MTGSWGSCSALFKGKMMLFGGEYSEDYNDQISEVQGCKLQRIGQFPSFVDYPACNTFAMPDERVWICFNTENKNGCKR